MSRWFWNQHGVELALMALAIILAIAGFRWKEGYWPWRNDPNSK